MSSPHPGTQSRWNSSLRDAIEPPPAPIFAATSTSVPAKVNLPKASSKEELVQSLETHPDKKELLKLELDTLGEDWLLALQEELTKPYFLTLKEFVTKEQQTKKVFPPGESGFRASSLGQAITDGWLVAQDIYSWSRLCPLKDVRVVIVGMSSMSSLLLSRIVEEKLILNRPGSIPCSSLLQASLDMILTDRV